jgi:hypothetical protein
VTAPAATRQRLDQAGADIGGADYGTQRLAITYGHIPAAAAPAAGPPEGREPRPGDPRPQRGLPARGRRQHGGEPAADGLQVVTELTGADLTAERLKGFDAVVIGVRAFNTRTDLAAHLKALFAYVEAGGTVVEQYNTPGGLQTSQLAPYPLKLSRDLPRYRVTDEKAPVTCSSPTTRPSTRPTRSGRPT